MAFTYKTSIKSIGADYERKKTFYEKSIVIDTTKKTLSSAGIVMDCSANNTIATTTDESHVFIIGGTGNGKTRRVIVPSVFSIAKTGSSLVLTDPKGELFRQTSDYLRKHDYEVMVINFRNPSKGNRWNPLGIIENCYRKGTEESIDKATIMLKDLVDTIGTVISSKNDKFWEQAALSLFMGVAMSILEYGDPGTLTFENISEVAHDFVRQMSNSSSDAARFYNSLPSFSIIKRNLSVAYQPSVQRTVENILAVFDTMLFQYTNQHSLLDFMSRSEADFEKIGEKPTALFMILPDDSTALYPLASIMIKQLYTTLLQIADANVANKGRLNNKVTFLLDEFGTLCGSGNGFIPDFPIMMTAARSRGIQFALVCQSIEQLRINYTSDEANTISSNCKVWIYMNSRDYDFLQQLQKLVGDYTSPYTDRTQPLISIQDLQRMPLGEVLVLNDFCGPYIGHLKDFTEYDFGTRFNTDEADVPDARAPFNRLTTTLHDLMEEMNEREEQENFREEDPINYEDTQKPWYSNPEGPKRFIEGVKTRTIPCLAHRTPGKHVDWSYTVIEEVLLYQKWKNRQSVMAFATKLVEDACGIKDYPEELKDIFLEAKRKLEGLSFKEMKEIISIISSDNGDESEDDMDD